MSSETQDWKGQILGISSTTGETRKIHTDDNGFLQTSIVGSLTKNLTDQVVTANTNIFTQDYVPDTHQKSTLMVMTNTSGVLSLAVDGKLGTLNGGTALDANKWYAFEVPLLAGSTYNLQLPVGATMQIKWLGGV